MKTQVFFAVLAEGAIILLANPPKAHHRSVGPADSYPDAAMTPGAANPEITQEIINDNICNRHWSTKLIRPSTGYTNRLKCKQLREYRDTFHQTRAELINPDIGKVDTTRCAANSDSVACYEEDHLVSLEDGGDPEDPRNLWPEPYNTRVAGTIMGARQKDVVECYVHDEICYDSQGSEKNSYVPATASITLKGGQEILAGDWYACYEAIMKGKPCK
jgi:hypothetical protein